MNRMTVLYDETCGFCVKCRWWVQLQPKYLEVEMLPSGGPDAAARYPELAGQKEELIAIDDEGGIYRGATAWLLCLWALEDYREWAERLSTPLLRPLARGAFAMLSGSRKKLSSWLGLKSEEELLEEFRRAEPPRCEG